MMLIHSPPASVQVYKCVRTSVLRLAHATAIRPQYALCIFEGPKIATALAAAALDGVARAGEDGEEISSLRGTELPPRLRFIASKTTEERIDYIRAILARSEDKAVAVLAPALQHYVSASEFRTVLDIASNFVPH